MIDEKVDERIVDYLKEGWNKMMISKIKVIYHELLKYDYVLYTDGDIIFKNPNIINYLLSTINGYDILFQKNKNDILCCGFMFIKSNERTKDIFNYKLINMNTFICDEDYMNKNKDKIKYNCLRRGQFPIERYYRKYLDAINPYMIHFNIEGGTTKEKNIKELNYWYLN